MWVRSPQAVKSDIIDSSWPWADLPSLLTEVVPVQTGKQPIFTPVYQASQPIKSHSQEFALYLNSLLSISGCTTYLLKCTLEAFSKSVIMDVIIYIFLNLFDLQELLEITTPSLLGFYFKYLLISSKLTIVFLTFCFLPVISKRRKQF